MRLSLIILYIFFSAADIQSQTLEFQLDFNLNQGSIIDDRHNNKEYKNILERITYCDTIWISVSYHYNNDIKIFESGRCANALANKLSRDLNCVVQLYDLNTDQTGIPGVFYEVNAKTRFLLKNRRHIRIFLVKNP